MSIKFETHVVTPFGKPRLVIKSTHCLDIFEFSPTNMFSGEPTRSPMVSVEEAKDLRDRLDQFISEHSGGEQETANASLIAAAPKMYEALLAMSKGEGILPGDTIEGILMMARGEREPDKTITEIIGLYEAAPAPEPLACPFGSYAGEPIKDGDVMAHPDGDTFIVCYDPRYSNPWRAVYSDGDSRALDSQIGWKGMVILKREGRTE